ncbi:helix-turn-helix domain-containing protein [Mucilaginibacter pocheonensis]|uniref:AraC-like DNA-binding protein n=1 Tax=Mucilaginibacter pocheonensis TaxID=398050 RepID=A0ABU1T539_9SPHI|nr:AraC family transcriptional regulator [Mucilaginibacter pocheonensis]MDR6940361.1 AraC-like DNA-binding protein [Mucilaginibacter pocheonensis]
MTPQLLLYNVICIGFFLFSLISFVNPVKVNNIANRWFSLFLFSVGCSLLNVIIYEAKAERSYTQLIAFNELSRFAMAPALYLSILHFTSPHKAFKRQEYLHFIPFLLFFCFMAPVAFMAGGSTWGNTRVLPPIINTIMAFTMFVSIKGQMLIYWILAWRKLKQHEKNIRVINSNTGEVSLNWLKYLLLGIAFMLAIWYVSIFLQLGFMRIYAPIGYLAGSLFIFYFLLAQKEIYPFDEPDLEDISTIIKEKSENNAVRKRVPDERSNELKNKLEHLMQNEKLYLDNELSLPQLAREMAVSTHELSYLLNENFGINFFQFVNKYRVEEVKRLMLSEKHRHLNILGIAFSAGFNSKTTFNTTFKKETGIAPSQFMQHAKTQGAAQATGSVNTLFN